jgi:SAM-dependent methyltransferase
MHRLPKRHIAASYLPSRYHYWYSLSKLATDPLYEAVRGLFPPECALLDVGCGIGLLLHCLRAGGCDVEYCGVDNDRQKIELARAAAANRNEGSARFEVCDLAQDFPQHRGSVALLDVLQYLQPDVRETVVGLAARCLTAQGKLVIRVGLDEGGWRAVATRAAERLGHIARWLPPLNSQPKRAELAALLARHGLSSEFRPLWQGTPFNNWLVVAGRA